jgi:ATP-dependent Clp protease ATP-binding subunit ClpA
MINQEQQIENLEAYLESKVIGQSMAVKRVSNGLKGALFGLNNTGPRPIARFLFMGPTGVGKTSITKAFSEFLFGPENLTMFFMNEMQSPLDVPLMAMRIKEAVNKHPEGTVFLFDEVEKACKQITDIFISLLDEGQITLSNGERISIANCITVMTSNIGSALWGRMKKSKYATMERTACEAAQEILRRELFMRITDVIVFKPLDHEAKINILELELKAKLNQISAQFPDLKIDERPVKDHLLRKCFSQSGGARALQNELNRQINVALIPWVNKGASGRRLSYESRLDMLVLR